MDATSIRYIHKQCANVSVNAPGNSSTEGNCYYVCVYGVVFQANQACFTAELSSIAQTCRQSSFSVALTSDSDQCKYVSLCQPNETCNEACCSVARYHWFSATVSTVEKYLVLGSTVVHRLNGSSSPVLTATCLSYGRLCDFLTFFSSTDLEVTPLDRFWRKMAQMTWIHARTCLLG